MKAEFFRKPLLMLSHKYRTCLFRQFVTFSSVPGRIAIFCVHFCGLICQFAQFVTSFCPLEAFCSANTLFTVSFLMSKQLVRVAIQTN